PSGVESFTSESSIFYCTSRASSSATFFPYTTLFRSDDEAVLGFAHDGKAALRRLAQRLLVEQHAGTGPGTAPDTSAQLVQLRQSDRKSTRLNSSHVKISYAVFCLK